MSCCLFSSVFFSNFSFCSNLAFLNCISTSYRFGLCFDLFAFFDHRAELVDCLLNHTNTFFNFFSLLYDFVVLLFCLKHQFLNFSLQVVDFFHFFKAFCLLSIDWTDLFLMAVIACPCVSFRVCIVALTAFVSWSIIFPIFLWSWQGRHFYLISHAQCNILFISYLSLCSLT